MGSLTKVILEFEDAFWPAAQYVFGRISTDVSEAPTSIVNMWKTHGKRVLALLIGGDVGRANHYQRG
jgi:hypothetical protein